MTELTRFLQFIEDTTVGIERGKKSAPLLHSQWVKIGEQLGLGSGVAVAVAVAVLAVRLGPEHHCAGTLHSKGQCPIALGLGY